MKLSKGALAALLASSTLLAACSKEDSSEAPAAAPAVIAETAPAVVAAQTTASGSQIQRTLPDGRNVTFDCSALGTAADGSTKILTGAFVSAADYTTDAEIQRMKSNNTYNTWVQSRADQTSARSGLSMMMHLDTHPHPYKYCSAQAQQIRTGVFTPNSNSTCPPADAYLQCTQPR